MSELIDRIVDGLAAFKQKGGKPDAIVLDGPDRREIDRLKDANDPTMGQHLTVNGFGKLRLMGLLLFDADLFEESCILGAVPAAYDTWKSGKHDIARRT